MAKYSGAGNKNPLSRDNYKPGARPAAPLTPPPAVRPREQSKATIDPIKKEVKAKVTKAEFIFEKRNYQFMLGGLALIILGFYLMSGTTDIMSSTKIVLAPILVLSGFAVEFYAILTHPKKSI